MPSNISRVSDSNSIPEEKKESSFDIFSKIKAIVYAIIGLIAIYFALKADSVIQAFGIIVTSFSLANFVGSFMDSMKPTFLEKLTPIYNRWINNLRIIWRHYGIFPC